MPGDEIQLWESSLSCRSHILPPSFNFPLFSLNLFHPLFLVGYSFLSKEIGLPFTNLSRVVLSIFSLSVRASTPVLCGTWKL